MDKEELLPCPFCGGRADIVGPRMYEGFTHMYAAECSECLATYYSNTEQECIKAWNTRISND